MKKIFVTILLSTIVTFALKVGELPKEVIITGENGSCVNGTEWKSTMLKDKIYVLFYVDPDKKSDSDIFIKTLETKKYDNTKFSSVAILNLKATWLPNFAIEKKLEAQQEKLPNTLYVKDKTKYLVKEWALADDSVNIVLFNKDGKVIYYHVGLMTDDEIKKVFLLIEENIAS